jgi:hypothetical protein
MIHRESSRALPGCAQRTPSPLATLESLIISPFPLESPALPLPKTGRLVWLPKDGKFGRASFFTHHRPAPEVACAAAGDARRARSNGGEGSWMK